MTRKYLALVALAILPILLISNANADEDKMPPLVLKSPDNYEVTTDKLPHTYQVYTSYFVVVDDSGQSTNLYCGLDSSKRDHISRYKNFQLVAGEFMMNCDIKDRSGNTTTVSWNILILQDDLAPSWVKTVGGLYCNNTINEELYLKVIKYLTDAGVMVFDIQGSGYGEVPSDFKSNTCNWKKGSLSNGEYKIILEDMASNGVFQNVSY